MALPVTAGGSPNLNGAGEAPSPARSATAEDDGGSSGGRSGWQKQQQQQAELTVSALLKAITPDLSSPAPGEIEEACDV